MKAKVCKDCSYYSARHKECNNPKFVEEIDTPKDGLSVFPLDGVGAGFYVGPLFGCIHWKETK